MRGLVARLFSHSAIYGLADVFTNITNILLAPILTAFITPADYGIWAILNLFSACAKIFFRLRLDDAFLRTHYEQRTAAERHRHAGTLWIFSAVVGTLLFAAVVLCAGPLTALLFSAPHPAKHFLILSATDVWLSIFGFIPQGLLRIQDKPRTFTAFTMLRHAVTIGCKLVLAVRGFGVAALLWADIAGTLVFTAVLLPTLLRNIAFAFDFAMLRNALRFALPKVPHALLIQVQNLIDRPLLDRFVSLADVGVYSFSYSLGAGVKFGSSAFEPAWGPFVYSQLGKPDAARTQARIITYAFAGFLVMALLVSVFAREALQVLAFKRPELWAGAAIVPVVALAYLLHGVFLLTSIGLGIEKKTSVYPLIALVAGVLNVAANLALIPRYGIMGAAWATVISYATMAALGAWLSARVYPLPLEIARLLRLSVAAAACFTLSRLAPAPFWSAVAWKAACCAAFPLLAAALGFLRDSERAQLRAWLSRR